MDAETLYFLRDLLHEQTLSVSTPDFRDRARLVCDALDQLDAAILATPLKINDGDMTASYLSDSNAHVLNTGYTTPPTDDHTYSVYGSPNS